MSYLNALKILNTVHGAASVYRPYLACVSARMRCATWDRRERE